MSLFDVSPACGVVHVERNTRGAVTGSRQSDGRPASGKRLQRAGLLTPFSKGASVHMLSSGP